jgi:hypothetical protein
MSTEQVTIVVPSSPADRAKIFSQIKEISASMTKIEGEKSVQKEIIAALAEEFDLPKKYLSKMAKTYHKQSFDQEVRASEDFSTLYETVTNQTSL